MRPSQLSQHAAPLLPDSAESFTAGGRLSPAGLTSAAGAPTGEGWNLSESPPLLHGFDTGTSVLLVGETDDELVKKRTK